MSTQEIRDIYKKSQITKQQAQEKLRKEMSNTLEGQLSRVFKKYFELLQDPKISVAVQDEAKREMDNTLDIIRMDTDHDVIMALTNNLVKKQYMEKIKNG